MCPHNVSIAERLGPPLGADPEEPGLEQTIRSRRLVKRRMTQHTNLNMGLTNRGQDDSSVCLDSFVVCGVSRIPLNSINEKTGLLNYFYGSNSSDLVN